MAKTKKHSATKAPKVNFKRSITSSYSKRGPGRKETFKNRRDTIWRKGNELSEKTGAYFLGLIYQPHRKQWHVSVSANAPKDVWPFPLEEFLSTYDPPPIVTQVTRPAEADSVTVTKTGREDASESDSDSDITTYASMSRLQPSSSEKQHLPDWQSLRMLQGLATVPFKKSTVQFSPLMPSKQFSEWLTSK